jgi:hypothetical protein
MPQAKKKGKPSPVLCATRFPAIQWRATLALLRRN